MEASSAALSRLVSVDPAADPHRCYICHSDVAADSKFSGSPGKWYSLYLHASCLQREGLIPSLYK